MLDIKAFPTTRYQGSKRKILDWIHENLKDIEFETVLDGFGGTGSCSYLFKKMGKVTTYNDNLKFNYFIGKAIIENQQIRLNDNDIKFVLNFRNSSNGFISKNFKDCYYTEAENQWLDAVVKRIEKLTGYSNDELEYKKMLCYYALFQASLRKRPFNLFHRKNLYIRTNDVKRNFGNKTTWEKSFESEFRFFVSEVNNIVFNSNRDSYALNKSIFDIDADGYDLVYLDPPYISSNGTNESSDYLRCYHFLEGISNYANWNELIDFETINLRFKKEIKHNDFDKVNIYNSIDALFCKFKDSKIVLSYKIGGIPSVDDLETLMRKYKNNVEVKTRHYKYALNKQNGNAAYNREVLIIGT